MVNYFLFLVLGIFVWNVQVSHSASESCDLYKRYCLNHTICKSADTECQILTVGVSRNNRDLIVKLHNEYRSKIATGGTNIENLPPASDMMQMEWDSELAEISQAHASQCRFLHDCPHCRKTTDYDVGQNIYKRTIHERISQWPGENWKQVVKAWFTEIDNFNTSCVKCFDPTVNKGTAHHFIQLISAQTWLVGCGYTLYTEDGSIHQIMVCNYGPAGSGLHKQVYTPGKACENCPTNTACYVSSDPNETGPFCGDKEGYDYEGLCKLDADEFYPRYKMNNTDSIVFECDLEHLGRVCKVSSPSGQSAWKRIPSHTGTYLGVTLRPGEMSTLNFTNQVNLGEVSHNCVCLDFRRGPTRFCKSPPEIPETEANLHFFLIEEEINFVREIKQGTHDFTQHCEQLDFSSPLKLSVTFKVKYGATKSYYFEIRNVHVKSEACSQESEVSYNRSFTSSVEPAP